LQLPPTRSSRHRIAAVIAILGLLFVGALSFTGASATAHRAKRRAPSLTLAHRNPATVTGHNFQPRVRVHVRLVAGQTLSRNPVANRAGSFTVTFAAVIDRCSSWSVLASQRHHATVVLRGPKPECPPA
jgi:hypothetical protein